MLKWQRNNFPLVLSQVEPLNVLQHEAGSFLLVQNGAFQLCEQRISLHCLETFPLVKQVLNQLLLGLRSRQLDHFYCDWLSILGRFSHWHSFEHLPEMANSNRVQRFVIRKLHFFDFWIAQADHRVHSEHTFRPDECSIRAAALIHTE